MRRFTRKEQAALKIVGWAPSDKLQIDKENVFLKTNLPTVIKQLEE